MINRAVSLTLLLSSALLVGLWYNTSLQPEPQLNSITADQAAAPQTIPTADYSSVDYLPITAPEAANQQQATKLEPVNFTPDDQATHSLPSDSASEKTSASNTLEQQTAENSSLLPIINAPHIPAEVLETLRDSLRNALAGNIEYAALLSIEAAEQLPSNKAFAAQMYSTAGRYYEQLQFHQSAIAQYRLAQTYVDKHSTSYNALRRLDREFASQHPPLKDAGKKPNPDKRLSN